MSERVIVGEQTFECATGSARTARDWRRFTIVGTSAAALAAFVPDAVYHREWDSVIYDGEGNPQGTEVLTEDLTEYCIVGDVIDHRDGTVSVYLGKKTESETLQETVEMLLLQILFGGM